jgi:hypothetical protein
VKGMKSIHDIEQPNEIFDDQINSLLHKRQKNDSDELSKDNEKLKELFYSTKKEIKDFYVKQENIHDEHKKYIIEAKADM